MIEPRDAHLEATCGVNIRGLGVTRPLMRLRADPVGVALVPRWRWLGWLLFRECAWSWADVERLEVLLGPLGGVHGVRVRLAGRLAARRFNGAVYPWLRKSRQLVVGLTAADVKVLLEIAPPAITRATARGLLAWG